MSIRSCLKLFGPGLECGVFDYEFDFSIKHFRILIILTVWDLALTKEISNTF